MNTDIFIKSLTITEKIKLKKSLETFFSDNSETLFEFLTRHLEESDYRLENYLLRKVWFKLRKHYDMEDGYTGMYFEVGHTKVKDITKEVFLTIGGAGEKAWLAFEKIRNN